MLMQRRKREQMSLEWMILADQVKKGEMNFDVVIASPDAMRVVGQLGQILGTKRLNAKP